MKKHILFASAFLALACGRTGAHASMSPPDVADPRVVLQASNFGTAAVPHREVVVFENGTYRTERAVSMSPQGTQHLVTRAFIPTPTVTRLVNLARQLQAGGGRPCDGPPVSADTIYRIAIPSLRDPNAVVFTARCAAAAGGSVAELADAVERLLNGALGAIR